MTYNNSSHAAAKVQRDALRTALFTFATVTVPSLAAAAADAVVQMDPGHPVLDSLAVEDVRFYAACVRYVSELRAQGRYAGPALRYP